MKILQLHAGYRVPAGEDSVVANEAETLTRGGHEVRQLIVPNPTALGPSVVMLARSVHNRPIGALVRSEIEAFGPDVVHVHNTWFSLSSSAVTAATKAGVAVVMTVHNYRFGCVGADLFRDGAVCTACVGRSPVAGVAHGCYRGSRLLSAAMAAEIAVTRRRGVVHDAVARFVAPSGFMADRLVDIGLPADRLVVKPHFVADPGPRTAAASSSGEVLMVGRLAAGKGLHTLIEAWSQRPRRHDAAGGARTLSIVGDGPLADDLRRSAHDDTVRFDGWQPRHAVVERMLAARALVMPSEWYEPFGMVLIEAMSAGLPVIVSTVAGARTIVGAPAELVVPPGDPAALALAIDRLDDATVDAVGAANRTRFEADYSEDAGLAALESLYAEAVMEHGSR
jgi:glycosyltransferase involved in cell wall biosynthesis